MVKAKNAVTIALLGFVGVTVAWMVVEEFRSAPVVHEGAGPGAPAEPARETAGTTPETVQKQQTGSVLMAYYFHRTQRCRTCLTIERYAREALADAFPEALQAGQLVWHTVNVEEPEHEHFVTDYEITSGALVLVNTRDGAPFEWRNLTRVWDLVGDELRFKAYVEAEAMLYLEGDL